MNQEVSTVDPSLITDIPDSGSIAQTDFTPHKVRNTSQKSAFTWTGISELDINEDFKKYLNSKLFDISGHFSFLKDFAFLKQNIFSNPIEHSTIYDKKIRFFQIQICMKVLLPHVEY